jgi:hypothetical protein
MQPKKYSTWWPAPVKYFYSVDSKFLCNIDWSVMQILLKLNMTKKLTKQPETALAGTATGVRRLGRAGAKHSSKASPKAKTETHEQVGPDAIARLAYSYWEARGYTDGSPEEDWLRAEHELRSGC